MANKNFDDALNKARAANGLSAKCAAQIKQAHCRDIAELRKVLHGCLLTMEWFASYPDQNAQRIARKHFDAVKDALAKADGK